MKMATTKYIPYLSILILGCNGIVFDVISKSTDSTAASAKTTDTGIDDNDTGIADTDGAESTDTETADTQTSDITPSDTETTDTETIDTETIDTETIDTETVNTTTEFMDTETVNTTTEFMDTESTEAPDTDSLEKDTNTGSDEYPSDGTDETVTTDTELVGYAAVNALGRAGTNGGEGDLAPITVTSAEAFQKVIDEKGSGPRIIYVAGHLTHPSIGRIMLRNIANVSIIGKGDSAELDGFGLTMSGASNIIVQNLKIHHVYQVDGDAIRILDESHHIWIDHCEFYNDGPYPEGDFDGLIDITHASDYITVSWNYLHDSYKGMLVGHSDDNRIEDEGTLHISYHHNRIERVGGGAPSARFGRVHIWNNHYREIVYQEVFTGYAVSARVGACISIENALFQDVTIPIVTNHSGDEAAVMGQVDLSGNVYENYTEYAKTPVCDLTPPYGYESFLEPADDLEATLDRGIGVGKINLESQSSVAR